MNNFTMFMCKSNSAIYRINLIDYLLREHDMVFMPPDTIVEIESLSDDYAVEVLVVNSLPGVTTRRLLN